MEGRGTGRGSAGVPHWRGAAGTRVLGALDGDPGLEGRSGTRNGGCRAGRAEWDRKRGCRAGGAPGVRVPEWRGVAGTWVRDRAAGMGAGGRAGGNRESRRTGAQRAARPGNGAAPARRGTGPRTPPPLHPVARGRTGRPGAPRPRAARPVLAGGDHAVLLGDEQRGGDGVLVPLDLAQQHRAAALRPGVDLGRHVRAAAAASGRAAHQLTAAGGAARPAGFAGAPGRVGAALP